MGAGKSTVGARLASRLGLDFCDLDALLARRAGASIAAIFEREGETGFRRREAALLREVAAREGLVVATGGGCVLDAGNRRLLGERGVTVYLETPVDLQLKRLQRARDRPLLEAPDRRERLAALLAERDPLYREVADLVVETEDVPSPVMAERILAHLQASSRQFFADGAAQ